MERQTNYDIIICAVLISIKTVLDN